MESQEEEGGGCTQPFNSQDVVGDSDSTDETPPDHHGILCPTRPGLPVLYLSSLSFKTGRCEGGGLDYDFRHVKNENWYSALSKDHFTLTRENDVMYLRDSSNNGTFVNGDRVGKGKSRILLPNDLISVARKDISVFRYFETTDDNAYPKDLTERFLVTKKELGRGAMGRVMQAYDKKDDYRSVAVKVIEKEKLSQYASVNINVAPEHVRREINIMRAVQHPCCIEVMCALDLSQRAFIVMEKMEGGELFDRIVNPKYGGKGLGEHLSKFYAYQMLRAIQYLHRKDITHRDLKPENILLIDSADETLLKISDFGLSKLLDEQTVLKTYCGTPTYQAPEVVEANGTGQYTNAIDMWSLGVIFFVCLTGYPPFAKEYVDMPLRDQILTGRLIINNRWKDISSQALDFVQQLLKVKPTERLTADQALGHPWFAEGNAANRADELMRTHKFYRNTLQAQASPMRKRERPVDMEVDDGQLSVKKGR